ncbi:HNH endonuclease [Luteibacter sp. 3190]|uniref:HNH endonuclease n=1 Tax=Luteibacter sp. 3190 TaxID=2817736 RepID=UPI00285888CB|nr:HNH endonuclease [Luteibacter sp. 3190]MDR6938202.1 5-methylcytosine-specific restriction protein A [Luteibacter sp. 3190]
MAKTAGRGNPPWTRDETILALDLFFDAGMVALSDSDPRVIQLSQTLRALPGNELRAESPSFRNPAGVSFKLSNLQSVATGRGFANSSATDLAVWKQFESRRQKVKEIATLILKHVAEAPLETDDQDDEELEFPEGSVFTAMHRRRERNRKLRKSLIKERRKHGSLSCDACGKVNPTDDPNLDDAIFDAHHLIPLAEQGERKTRLTDVALLCANCHRLMHRLIAKSGKWLSAEDLKGAVSPDNG